MPDGDNVPLHFKHLETFPCVMNTRVRVVSLKILQTRHSLFAWKTFQITGRHQFYVPYPGYQTSIKFVWQNKPFFFCLIKLSWSILLDRVHAATKGLVSLDSAYLCDIQKILFGVRQYVYARTARVPLWPISVPQRVRIFKQSATKASKGRVLNTKCVQERVYGFFSGCARDSVECQKLRKIGQFFGAARQQLYQWTTFQRYLCHKGYPFLWICASKGMDLGPNFVPVRVGFCKFCASEGRGFPVPS